MSPDTLTRKLKEAGHTVTGRKLWTARQCCEALRGTGDREAVRYRRDAAEAELAEIEVAKARRDVVDVAEVVDVIARIFQPFRTRLLALAATLGHAANPSDPVHGMAAVNRAIDSLLPLLREDVINAFKSGSLDDSKEETEEPEEE